MSDLDDLEQVNEQMRWSANVRTKSQQVATARSRGKKLKLKSPNGGAQNRERWEPAKVTLPRVRFLETDDASGSE